MRSSTRGTVPCSAPIYIVLCILQYTLTHWCTNTKSHICLIDSMNHFCSHSTVGNVNTSQYIYPQINLHGCTTTASEVESPPCRMLTLISNMHQERILAYTCKLHNMVYLTCYDHCQHCLLNNKMLATVN